MLSALNVGDMIIKRDKSRSVVQAVKHNKSCSYPYTVTCDGETELYTNDGYVLSSKQRSCADIVTIISQDRIAEYQDQQDRIDQAYRNVFAGQDGIQVLKDLANYCNISRSNQSSDDQFEQLLAERQYVFYQIAKRLHLSDQAIDQLISD